MYCGEFNKYNIIICGTGATGSQLIPFVTQLLSYQDNCRLTFIDGDRVETKNLKNQKFLRKDDGMSKSQVLQSRYKKIYPKLDVHYMDAYIKSADDLINLFETEEKDEPKTLHILVGCVDNNPTRKIMKDVFHNDAIKNMVYIDSGNGTESMQGQIVVGFKRIVGSKVRKNYSNETVTYYTKIVAPCAGDLFEDIVSDMETVDHVTSCSYVGDANPQNIATNIMAASTLFSIINQIICFKEVQTGITYFDAKNQSIVSREVFYEVAEYLDLEVTILSDTLKEHPNMELNSEGICFCPSEGSTITLENETISLDKSVIQLNAGGVELEYDDIKGNELTIKLYNCIPDIRGCSDGSQSYHVSANFLKPFIASGVFDNMAIYSEVTEEIDEPQYLYRPTVISIRGSIGNDTFEYVNPGTFILQYDENGNFVDDTRV